MNFKNTKTKTMKGIGNHSTLITFVLTAIGVGATIYFASKEVPKAEQEVKEILAKEDLTKQQKIVETTKSVAKNCWKTTVIALGTVLLVTGTSAITAANTAATVAGLTNTINIAEQKLKDYKEAVDEIPNKKVKEEVQQSVTQKAINRATANLKEEDYARNEACPDKYVWVDKFTGIKFKATYQMVDSLDDIIDAKITNRGYITIEGVFDVLIGLGAEILCDPDNMPTVTEMYGWNGGFELYHNVCMNDNGYTIHYIEYSEPTRDF